jgi:hypothetical protein
MDLATIAKVILASGLDMAAATPLVMEARVALRWEVFSLD